jgi:hypothetical protein
VPAVKSLLMRARENLRRALAAYVVADPHEAAGAVRAPADEDEAEGGGDEPD